MQDFKKLTVWTKGHKFTLDIYNISSKFPAYELFALTTQLRKSSSSIPANIAEGCGRKTKLDLTRFLYIALGSANESEYFLILAHDLSYIQLKVFKDLTEKIIAVRKMLIALIKKVA